MPIKKSKPKATSEVIEIDLLRTDPAELAKTAKEEGLDRRGIYPAKDDKGVSFGSPRQPREHCGEGLSELGEERGLFDQWKLNLDIRVSYDREGKTYLEVARPGSGTFHQFEFSGIEFDDVIQATGKFNNEFETFLIYYGLCPLFSALYRSRHTKKQDRLDALETLNEHFSSFFKSKLNPKRKREIESRELQRGIKITTYEDKYGRPDKSESEKELEKTKFLEEVFAALKQIESEGGKRTQLDVGLIVYEDKDSKDVQSLMKNHCRNCGLKWKDILSEYDRKKV